jgi:transcriptional regulator with XRE-family HTH domain
MTFQTFGQAVKEARKAQGLSLTKLGEMIDGSGSNIGKIELGYTPTYEVADALCKALGITYPIEQFKHQKRYKISLAPKKAPKPDTLAQDEAKARELGLSYGEYMSHKATGYLETFIKQREKLDARGGNVIESNLIGAGASGRRRVPSIGGKKS